MVCISVSGCDVGPVTHVQNTDVMTARVNHFTHTHTSELNQCILERAFYPAEKQRQITDNKREYEDRKNIKAIISMIITSIFC